MAAALRVPELAKNGKYLGLPADWGGSKRQMFSWILTRVQAKLEGWKEKMFSKAGKEILIKAVVQALPQYAMSLFKIPKSIVSAIEKRIAQFWWKNSESKAGIHWKKWEIMQKSKETGGMGFRDLLTFNTAMLGKQAWRLSQNPNALWCQIMKGLYFPYDSFWKANKGRQGSWGWQSILLGRDSIADSVIWKVGNGENIILREDKWLQIGKIGGPANVNDPRTVADLIVKEEHTWNEQLINSLFDAPFVNAILTIPLPRRATQDQLIWLGTKTGHFNVKSAYHRARTEPKQGTLSQPSSSYQIPSSFWKTLWQLKVPPRVRNFLWLLCQNALPTRDNLNKRRIVPEALCPLCHRKTETPEHLFLLCDWTTCIWNDDRLQIPISPVGLTRMDIWLQNINSHLLAGPSMELVAMVLWSIWKARNNWIFRRQHLRLSDLVEEAENQLKNHQIWNKHSRPLTGTTGEQCRNWVPPEAQALMWNVDGAFVEGDTTGYIAGVLRDSSGTLLDGFARQVPTTSALQTETLAVLEAFSLLQQYEGDRSGIETHVTSDCSGVTDAVSDPNLAPWQLREYFEEARIMLGSLPHVRLAHCRREANTVADWVASALRKRLLPSNWLCYPPNLCGICFV